MQHLPLCLVGYRDLQHALEGCLGCIWLVRRLQPAILRRLPSVDVPETLVEDPAQDVARDRVGLSRVHPEREAGVWRLSVDRGLVELIEVLLNERGTWEGCCQPDPDYLVDLPGAQAGALVTSVDELAIALDVPAGDEPLEGAQPFLCARVERFRLLFVCFGLACDVRGCILVEQLAPLSLPGCELG